MKKLFVAALSCSLTALFAVSAFAATTDTITSVPGTPQKSVSASYAPEKTATYNVDITWGDMSFNYKPTTHDWNPATRQYDDSVTGTFTPTATDANKIIVTNKSNIDMTAALSYAKASDDYTAIAAAFADGNANAVTTLDLASADNGGATGTGTVQTASAWLNLSSTNFTGKALNNTQIGTVTVTINPAD